MTRARTIRSLVVVALMAALTAATPTPAAAATVIHVDATAGGGAGTGTSWGDAFTDLVLNDFDGTINRSYVFLGQSDGIFDTTTRIPQTHPEAGVSWGSYEPFVGRFNGDTRDDVVWLSTESSNRVFVGLARE